MTSRISPTTIICSLRLHWQVNFDYTFRFTPTTLSDSLQIHSFVHSAYTSKLTLTTSLYLLPLQLLVHSDLAILEPFFSITPVGRFWLVKTSIWMTPFRFESSCARDGGMWWIILHRGDHIWSFFRRGAGIFLPWVILRRERHHDHIWIFEHSNFVWRQFRCGVMPLLYGKWVCLWPYMGMPQRRSVLGCIKLITLYY